MNDRVKDMAVAHVDWWLSSVRQLLIDNFVHGYKHGEADAFRAVNELEITERQEWLRNKAKPKRKGGKR